MDLTQSHRGDSWSERAELLWSLRKKMWRWRVIGKEIGFHATPNLPVDHCTYILGYENVTDMYNNWTPRSSQLIKQMLSEHGLIIYKALLAKANDREEQKYGKKC